MNFFFSFSVFSFGSTDSPWRCRSGKVQFHVRDRNLSFGTAALFPIYRHYESLKGRLSDDVRYEFRVGMVS